MSILSKIRDWTLQANIRTWASHYSLTLGAAIIHPLLGVGAAIGYLIRERHQVGTHEWTVDNIVDATAPAIASATALMWWTSSLALPWWTL